MAIFRRPHEGGIEAAEPGPEESSEPEVQAESEGSEEPLAPSRMRGTEPLYGYVVGLELVGTAILNIVRDTGAGAPAHPQTTLQAIAVAAAVAFFGVLQFRNRTIAGFGAIVAAFFVTLPKVPSSLSLVHVFALAIPLAYGLIITQRQRRAMGNAGRRGRGATARAAGPSRRGGPSAPASGSGRGRRRGKAPAVQPPGPRPNARYTPPKPKRGQGRVSGR